MIETTTFPTYLHGVTCDLVGCDRTAIEQALSDDDLCHVHYMDLVDEWDAGLYHMMNGD